ncbi:alpha/beta fold hydrolase [Streptomyces sp. NPDC054956]
MESVVVDGVRIAYERAGRGRPVVLVGGTGMPPVAWELCGLREDLVRADFEVITYAARGVAPSGAPSPPWSMAGAGPVTGVLDAMLDAEAELIAVTGRLPAAFTRLQTLLSSLPPAILREDEQQTRTWLELLGAQQEIWTSTGGEVGQATAAETWLRDPHRMAALADVAVPVLVLCFEHDLCFPPRASRAAADALPHGEFTVIVDAAHGGLLTHPKETSAALLAFLNRP